MQLVFLEEGLQVETLDEPDAQTTLVALTADALDAAEARGLTCEPISRYADPRALADDERRVAQQSLELLRDLERFIGERHPTAPARFLSQQAYHFQISIVEVATRAYLMREAIRAVRPDRVGVLEATSEPWFWPDAHAPWVTALEGMRDAEGFELERLALQRRPADVGGTSRRLRSLVLNRSRARAVARRVVDGARRVPKLDPDAPRILFVPYPNYDWAPVARRLRRRAARFALDIGPLAGGPDWTYALGRRITDLSSFNVRDLGREFVPDGEEAAVIASLVDEWIDKTRSRTLEVQGFDLLPALVPHLRSMASVSAGIARHAETIAERALDAVRPDAVCFFAIAWLATKRMADVCRSRGVPVVSYQHGGAYGTHDWTPQHLTDWADADYFLSYGPGIEPPSDPIVPQRAVFVPVGSARLASWKRAPLADPARRDLRVLWVAELASRNLLGYWLLEDTSRYLLERRCLELLGAAGVDVTYRPYSTDAESGVARWLRRAGPGSVRISSKRARLASLVRNADVVVSDTSSGTVWNEVLALGRPLVLYCEPLTTRPTPAFVTDLSEACVWCTSEDELVQTLERLAARETLSSPAGVDRFLSRYVLGDDDPTAQVVSFLESLARGADVTPTLSA